MRKQGHRLKMFVAGVLFQVLFCFHSTCFLNIHLYYCKYQNINCIPIQCISQMNQKQPLWQYHQSNRTSAVGNTLWLVNRVNKSKCQPNQGEGLAFKSTSSHMAHGPAVFLREAGRNGGFGGGENAGSNAPTFPFNWQKNSGQGNQTSNHGAFSVNTSFGNNSQQNVPQNPQVTPQIAPQITPQINPPINGQNNPFNLSVGNQSHSQLNSQQNMQINPMIPQFNNANSQNNIQAPFHNQNQQNSHENPLYHQNQELNSLNHSQNQAQNLTHSLPTQQPPIQTQFSTDQGAIDNINKFIYAHIPMMYEVFNTYRLKQQEQKKKQQQSSKKNQYVRPSLYLPYEPIDESPPKKYIIIKRQIPKKPITKTPLFSHKRDIFQPEPYISEFNVCKEIVINFDYEIKVLWKEGNQLIDKFSGTNLQIKSQEPSDEQFVAAMKKHINNTSKCLKNDDHLEVYSVGPRNKKNFIVKAKVERRKISLPKNYSYIPSNFSGFIVKNLSIMNEYGSISWPGQTNIRNADFQHEFSLSKNQVQCNISALKKEAIVQFCNFPQKVLEKVRIQSEAKGQEMLKKMAEKKGGKLLFCDFENEKWKVKIDFSKE